MKETVFISEWLKKSYPLVHESLCHAFDKCKVSFQTLPYSNDYWCRDFMPVHIGNGKYVGYNYCPDYLRDNPSQSEYITNQSTACEDVDLEVADITELSYDCKIHQDSWCYLNYLETDNGIILPALSETMDCDNDLTALECFKALFPQKEVVQVFSMPLINEGGAIHCITWNLFQQ